MYPELPSWVGGAMTYDGWGFSHLSDSTNTDLLIVPIYGRIGAYTGAAKIYKCASVYKCPSDRSQVEIKKIRYDRVRSYSLNCFVGWGHQDPAGDFRVYQKTIDLRDPPPAELFTFLDEHEDSIRRWLLFRWL